MLYDKLIKDTNLKVHPPKSISDQIYESVKEAILTNELEPREQLVESKLAQTFGASRTPIREAIQKLELEGLVERFPQGGVRVVPLTKTTLKEVFGIRMILEAYAAELACDKITKKELNELKKISDIAEKLMTPSESFSKDTIRELWKLNTIFHETILKSTGNAQLIKILALQRQLVLRFRILSLHDENVRIKAWEDHKLMIYYLEQKEKELIKALAKLHVGNAATSALKLLSAAVP